jgi:hypothetical protein
MKTDNSNPNLTQVTGQAALPAYAGLAASGALTCPDLAAPDWRGYCFPPPDETGFVLNEAAHMTAVLKARALFWECMARARALDAERGL